MSKDSAPQQPGALGSEPDLADEIAGIYQVSRGHAYELMERALAERYPAPLAVAWQCGRNFRETPPDAGYEYAWTPLYQAELPASLPAPVGGWISVEDRLPLDGDEVIIRYWPYDNRLNRQCTMGAIYEASRGVFLSDTDGDDVHPPSHWMSLPAAPTAAGAGKPPAALRLAAS